MSTQVTHWLTLGEPTDDGRVWAAIIAEYQTGPNESQGTDIEIGTVPMDALDTIQGCEHLHADDSLMLSALDEGTRTEIEGAFEDAPVLNELADRVADASPAQALDGYVLDELPLNARQWAEATGRARSTVARNASED